MGRVLRGAGWRAMLLGCAGLLIGAGGIAFADEAAVGSANNLTILDSGLDVGVSQLTPEAPSADPHDGCYIFHGAVHNRRSIKVADYVSYYIASCTEAGEGEFRVTEQPHNGSLSQTTITGTISNCPNGNIFHLRALIYTADSPICDDSAPCAKAHDHFRAGWTFNRSICPSCDDEVIGYVDIKKRL